MQASTSRRCRSLLLNAVPRPSANEGPGRDSARNLISPNSRLGQRRGAASEPRQIKREQVADVIDRDVGRRIGGELRRRARTSLLGKTVVTRGPQIFLTAVRIRGLSSIST